MSMLKGLILGAFCILIHPTIWACSNNYRMSDSDRNDPVVQEACEEINRARALVFENEYSPSQTGQAEVVEFYAKPLGETFKDRRLQLSVLVHVPGGIKAEKLARLFIGNNVPAVLAPVFASSTEWEDQRKSAGEIGAEDMRLSALRYVRLPNAMEAEVGLEVTTSESDDPRKLILSMRFDGALASLDGRLLFQQIDESTVLVHDIGISKGVLGGTVAMGHAMIFDIVSAVKRALVGGGMDVTDNHTALGRYHQIEKDHETFKIKKVNLEESIGILRVPLQGIDTLLHLPQVMLEFMNALTGREYKRQLGIISMFFGLPYKLVGMPMKLMDRGLTAASDGVARVTRFFQRTFDRVVPGDHDSLPRMLSRLAVTLPSLMCQGALASAQWPLRLAMAMNGGQWDDLIAEKINKK